MAKIKFSAFRAERSPGSIGGVTVKLDVGNPPFPPRVIETNKVSEIEAELARYAGEVGAGGEVRAVSVSVISGRKPNGFKAAFDGRPFIGINTD